jgi:CheY-like chemotaxis protein
LGSLELAQRRIEQGRIEGIAEYHALARQSAERASVLTQRLLAFSRRQPLDPKPVRANQLILAMEPLLRHTLGEAIRLDLDLAPDLRPVRCDPNQLDSAILNLAINARDAMPAGGTLLIRASNLDEDNKICIAVTDTGTGMPPDVVARAFDPFYTTKPIGQGTGLGLSMVYGFMRQSGGEARIASAVGAGTTISLTLPRHIGEDNMEPATPARLSLSPPSGRGTVVVVEDDPVVRMIIVEVLQDLGFDVLEAADGPSGLNFIEATAAIDLLITDIGLPGLNGRQLAEAARLTHPTLKIMFMTGYAEVAAMPHGFLAPGMELITKPFAIENLATKIQHLTSG